MLSLQCQKVRIYLLLNIDKDVVTLKSWSEVTQGH